MLVDILSSSEESEKFLGIKLILLKLHCNWNVGVQRKEVSNDEEYQNSSKIEKSSLREFITQSNVNEIKPASKLDDRSIAILADDRPFL